MRTREGSKNSEKCACADIIYGSPLMEKFGCGCCMRAWQLMEEGREEGVVAFCVQENNMIHHPLWPCLLAMNKRGIHISGIET